MFAAIDGKDVDGLGALVTDDVAFRFGNAETIHGSAAVEDASRADNETVGGVEHRRLDGGTLSLPCYNIFRFCGDLVADLRISTDVGPVFAPA